jgi:hypothetical protein
LACIARGEPMSVFRHALKTVLPAAVFIFCFPQNVFSYIDPGTGSYVFQIIVAAFVAASFMVKVYWKKIKGAIGRLFVKKGQ